MIVFLNSWEVVTLFIQQYARINRKVHMMTSYFLLMTFTNRIQAQQHRWKKIMECKGDSVKNKPHLITVNESISLSL